MSRAGLILAAHGSDAEPTTNALICAYADRIRRTDLFDEVVAAFHKGKPGFCAALDEMAAEVVTVVPVMTSAGYFCDSILPVALKRSKQFASASVRVTQPIGTHPRLAQIVERRIRCLLDDYVISPDDASIAIVGHGTQRHEGSRDATIELVERVRSTSRFGDVLAAFLDEEPGVETIGDRAPGRNVVVLPFMIGAGAHAAQDLPRRLGMNSSIAALPPVVQRNKSRLFICDAPIGTDPAMLDIVVDLALPTHMGQGTRMIA
jgi:sirohydrochlorin cobaltochelatase